ncbi:hypothetical protein HPB51_009387 [Rhipicephalus microplus]|uniref:Uncharacterized protein n=1 Tax=Rhipicephalus microplus TaxID=6941 RepID=A0A9J6F0G3_RHIMP|nr:hypothetical protein HPB51_009387 [Rhipicephalus microplus]
MAEKAAKPAKRQRASLNSHNLRAVTYMNVCHTLLAASHNIGSPAPAFGFLSKFFPIRNIILLSSAISSVSVALCFFVSDVFYISLLFGVIHGAKLFIAAPVCPL